MSQYHTLMNVKGPTVIAGEPGHIRRVGHNQQLDFRRLHRTSGFCNPSGVFLGAEVQGGGALHQIRISCVACLSGVLKREILAIEAFNTEH